MKLPVALAVVVLAASACGESSSVLVPNVREQDAREALAKLTKAGLLASIDLPVGEYVTESGSMLGDVVFDQQPQPGARVKRHSVVTLEFHPGPYPYDSYRTFCGSDYADHVPRVVGTSLPSALDRIRRSKHAVQFDLPPMPPRRTPDGLDAYVVRSVNPPPGTFITCSEVLALRLGVRRS